MESLTGGRKNTEAILKNISIRLSYETHKLSKKTLAYFDEVAKISIQNQQQLEEDNSKSFKEYLTDYR